MPVERIRLEFDEEKFIIVNLILNTDLCKSVLHLIDKRYFYSKGVHEIIDWMNIHYSKYNECLGAKINEYYEINASNLEPVIQEQIRNILEHLSAINSNEPKNIDYLKDRAITLFRKKFYENQVKVSHSYIEKGDLDNAEKALSARFDYSEELSLAKTLNDPDIYDSVIAKLFRGDDSDSFFRYSGRLGDFIGEIEAGWFVSFIAPPKVGKTVMLMESLVEALLLRKNVAFFSYEMPLKQIYSRIMRRIIGMATPEGGNFEVPVFDCDLNQKGTCSYPQRVGFGDLFDKTATTPTLRLYSAEIEWIPCSVCRRKIDSEYSLATWKKRIKREPISESEFRLRVDAFMRLYSKYCRSFFFPSKSAGVAEIENELDILVSRENFIPEIVIIDYADLIKPKGGMNGKRFELDDIWEGLRALGQSRLAALITASQTSKAAVDSQYIKQTDIAEDFSKIAKLDLAIGLSQTENLKAAGILNVNIVAARHGEFITSHVCTVLQDSKAMQGHLDSEFPN